MPHIKLSANRRGSFVSALVFPQQRKRRRRRRARRQPSYSFVHSAHRGPRFGGVRSTDPHSMHVRTAREALGELPITPRAGASNGGGNFFSGSTASAARSVARLPSGV